MVRVAPSSSESGGYDFSASSIEDGDSIQQAAPSSKYLIVNENNITPSHPQPLRAGTIWLAQAGNPKALSVRAKAPHIVPAEAVSLYKQGMALRKKAKFAEAKVFFEKAIAIDPQYYEARIERALMMNNLGQKKEAETEIKRILEEDPSNMSVRVASTIFLIFDKKTADLDKAQEILQAALEANPNDVRANYLMSGVLIFRNDYRGALVYLRKVEKLDNDNDAYLGMLCETLAFTEGKDAVSCFKEKLRKNPDDVTANLGITQIYLQTGRWSDALPYLERAIVFLPNHPMLLFVSASLLRYGRQDEAIVQFEKVIKLLPNNWMAHCTLAMLYYKKGLIDKAVSVGETGFKLAMESADMEKDEAFFREIIFVALILMEKMRHKEVIEMAQKCLSRFPNNPKCHLILGESLNRLAKDKKDFQESAREYELAIKNGFEDLPWVSLRLAQNLVYGLEEYDKGVEILKNILQMKSDKAEKIEAYTTLGDALGEQGEYGEALEYFNKAYFLNQNINGIHAKMGYLYHQLGRDKEAVAYLKIAIEKNADDRDLYLYIAEAYLNLEQDNNALAVIEKAVEKFPDEAAFHGGYGYVLNRVGKYEEALREFRKALTLDPSMNMYGIIGKGLFSLNKIPEAIAALEEGLKKDPKSQTILYWLGRALIRAKKTDQAIVVSKKLIELNKTVPEGFERLAAAYEEKGFFKEAVENRRIVVQLAPKNPWNHVALANALMRVGMSSEAVSEYKKAIDLEPDNGNLYLSYGRALREQKKIEMAVEVLKKGLRLSPQLGWLHLQLASYLVDQKKYEQAIQHFKRVLELKDQDSHARSHYALGQIYEIQKRNKEAEEEYRMAASLYNNSVGEMPALVLADLGSFLWRQCRRADGLKEIYKAKEMDPSNPDVRRALATMLYDEHRLEEAIAELRDILKVNQKNLWVYSLLGSYLFEAGRKAEAKDVYMKALATGLDDPQALNGIGYGLLQLDEIEKGTECVSKALAMAPGDPDIMDSLGYARFKSGRYDEALDLFRRAEKKYEEQKNERYEVYFHLGIALLQKGHVDEAIIHLERALKLNPEDKEVKKALQAARDKKAGKETSYVPSAMPGRAAYRISLADYARDIPFAPVASDEAEKDIERRLRAAEVSLRTEYAKKFFKGQRPAEAVAQLRRSIELDPDNYQLHVQLGDALMELHRYEQAIRSYEKALALNPSNESARKGKERGLKKLSEGFAPFLDSLTPAAVQNR